MQRSKSSASWGIHYLDLTGKAHWANIVNYFGFLFIIFGLSFQKVSAVRFGFDFGSFEEIEKVKNEKKRVPVM